MIFFIPSAILALLCLTVWRKKPEFTRGVLIWISIVGSFIFLVPAMAPILHYFYQGQPDPLASEIKNAVILPPAPPGELGRGIFLSFLAIFFPAIALISVFPWPSKKWQLKRSGVICAIICALGWAMFALIVSFPMGNNAQMRAFWWFYAAFFIFPALIIAAFYLILARWIGEGKFEENKPNKIE